MTREELTALAVEAADNSMNAYEYDAVSLGATEAIVNTVLRVAIQVVVDECAAAVQEAKMRGHTPDVADIRAVLARLKP